ncbi:carbohydrate ABC transporter permease [Paenibacillus flagellatus]|nr:carbohydrate ABC transporter permease [Paenibacillus flagellatus]
MMAAKKRNRARPWAGYGTERAKSLLLGRRAGDGLLVQTAVFILLLSIAVMYLSPLFYMLSTSLKDVGQLLDPTIRWFPRTFVTDNYGSAIAGLKYGKAVLHTGLTAGIAASLQVVSCALAGYAFARLAVPFKRVLFAVVLLTFLVPVQTLAIPLFVLYSKLGWLNTPLPFLVPAVFAQGIKGALFIVIFRQFFATLPKEMEESAKLDGAGALRTYARIMLPLAKPAMLVVFLFSFVWHWNAYFEPALFLKNQDFLALATQLGRMQSNLNELAGTPAGLATGTFDLNEPIKMAGAVLVVLPPLLLYMLAQKHFVQGIERTGLVE